MNKEDILKLIRNNPAFHLATVEGDQPRCRGMFLYQADDNGIVFHSGIMKAVHKQITRNPKVELCFNDPVNNVQVRVTGQLDIVEDKAFKDEICEHPSRKFVKTWREAGPLADFYASFQVYRLKSGKAVWWTMAENFAPKVEVSL
jgi:uncharacterized pyridoxamine 5'-phosphate oxidase family protein